MCVVFVGLLGKHLHASKLLLLLCHLNNSTKVGKPTLNVRVCLVDAERFWSFIVSDQHLREVCP